MSWKQLLCLTSTSHITLDIYWNNWTHMRKSHSIWRSYVRNWECHMSSRSIFLSLIDKLGPYLAPNFTRNLWFFIQGCTSTYHTLFGKIEDDAQLDIANEVDIAALHMVFLPIINNHLKTFQRSYIHHKIGTVPHSNRWRTLCGFHQWGIYVSLSYIYQSGLRGSTMVSLLILKQDMHADVSKCY